MWYARGMEVIYLDQLFAVNFLVDYCIVLAAARASNVPLRRGRYVLAALAGAGYAALTVLPGLEWASLAPVKLACGGAMALIAFGGETRFWRCAAVFFGVSALFGGAVLALSLAAGSGSPGGALQHATARILIPTFAVCYALTTLVFRSRVRRADRSITEVSLTVGAQTVHLRGMHDSGNALCDPATGAHAAVVSADAIAPLVGPLSPDPAAAVTQLRSRTSGARLIPYAAVGVPAGLLAAFRPDALTADGRTLSLLLAVSPTPVSPEDDYQLLLPSDL